MDSHLLKTKSIEQLVRDVEGSHKALRRTLTALDLTLLGIGAIIGTGIFVLTGTAAANQAGPGIMVSYLAAGLACGFAALCYAEFASMIPIAGSAYTYAYATLGELFAWMNGMVKDGLAETNPDSGASQYDNLLGIGNGNHAMSIETSASLGTITQVLATGNTPT